MNVKLESKDCPGIALLASEEWLAARKSRQHALKARAETMLQALSADFPADDAEGTMPLAFSSDEN